MTTISRAYPASTRYNPFAPWTRTVPLKYYIPTFDGSTPSASSLTGSGTTITSAAFTPPDGSLVVVFAGVGWSSTARPIMSCSDTSSAVWQNPVSAYGTSSNGGGVAAFRHYFATSPGSITVTITYTGFTAGGGRFIDTLVFTGCNPDQSTAATAKTTPTTGTDGTVTITTTQLNSWVWGISDDATGNTTWTANANSVLDTTDSVGATDSITLVGWRGIGYTNPVGATTFGGTWGASATSNQLALEILPVLPVVPTVALPQGEMLMFM